MYKILFVDDDVESAKEYAEQVEIFIKERVKVCGRKQEALDAVRQYPIEVVVLDQRMPEIRGTELYEEIRRLSPRTRAIMLSGEAEGDEIGQAMNQGYKMYLHKSKNAQLPRAVLDQMVRFRTERAREINWEPVHLFTYKVLFGIRGSVKYTLDFVHIEDEGYIHQEGWRLIEQISIGEKKIVTETYELKADLQFDQDFEMNMSANVEIGAKVAAVVKNNISKSIRLKFAAKQVLSERKMREVRRELSGPPEPTEAKADSVRSRSFYWAPTYLRAQCFITKTINPLNEIIVTAVGVLVPKNEIATMQQDILSSGRIREVRTDIFRLE